MAEIRVTVSRWETLGPWWQGRRHMRGLVLEIDGHGTTQTYGTRDLDAARTMVLDYLDCVDAPAPADLTIVEEMDRDLREFAQEQKVSVEDVARNGVLKAREYVSVDGEFGKPCRND